MNIASDEARNLQRSSRTEPVILFSISGQTLAASAGAILEIRSTNAVLAGAMRIPPIVPKVRYLLRREGETFFVISGWAHFGLARSPEQQVLIFRNSGVAVLVESIDRMAAISRLRPLPAGFRGAERKWYRGITFVSEHVIPVINPSGLLAEEEITAVRGSAAGTETQVELAGPKQATLSEEMQ